MIESFSSVPLTTIAPSYPYFQYSDDSDIQAFFDSYNALAQTYLDWFNQTPLGVYTNMNISGPLLDWIANGLYGISRPFVTTSSSKTTGGWDSSPYNSRAYNSLTNIASETAVIVSDDVYKRLMTWMLYVGDGKQMTAQWLRRRIARFIYGTNGTDIDIAEIANIGLILSPLPAPAAPVLSSVAGGTIGATTYYAKVTYVTPLGETLAGAETSLAVAADYLLVVDSPPAYQGATGYNVYISTTTGTETRQNAVAIALGTNWTEPTTGLVAGSALPVSNTSLPAHNGIIVLPNLGISAILQNFLSQKLLSMPFQMTFTMVIA